MQESIKKITAALYKLRGEKNEPEEKDRELLKLLKETQEELSRCRRNLMFADSEALTDMYIYSIKAHEIRYAHLLQLAKKTAI